MRSDDRRARRELAKRVRSYPGRRTLVSLHDLLEALSDDRIGHGVQELLALSAASARAETERKRQCFICCSPWTFDLPPLGVVCAEIVGTDEALVSLVCCKCWSSRLNDGVFKALERDLGCKRKEFQIVHEPARAD
jgi:hypothetical protein